MPPPSREILYGSDEPAPVSLELRAGALAATLRGGALVHLRAGDDEVWDGVAFLYRDADWRTPAPQLAVVESDVRADAFRVRLAGAVKADAIIDVAIDIEGSPDGRIVYRGEAIPRGDVAANRIGLCVTHGSALAGRELEVIHDDGRSSRSTWPVQVPAWPPFTLVRAIRHAYADGGWARCTFDGDVFEVEDQRNNADAAFKTYGRSNMAPRPFTLAAGEAVRQSVELRLESAAAPRAARRSHDDTVDVVIGAATRPMPQIGVEIDAADLEAGPAAAAALRDLAPAFVHASLRADAIARWNWPALRDVVATTSCQLRLDVTLDAAHGATDVLDTLAAALRAAGLAPESVAVFPSDRRTIDTGRAAFPASAIGGGTPHFFVQLNRAERLGTVDFLTFTSASIVHGTDDDTVMDGLASYAAMLATLRARHGGIPVRVGPSAIAARASPLGRLAPSDGRTRVALAGRDPRSRGVFGAAWTVGHAAALAQAGAAAITFASLGGGTGVTRLAGEEVERFPAFAAIAALGARGTLRDVRIDDHRRMAAIAFDTNEETVALVANLREAPTRARLRGLPAAATCDVLDAASPTAFRAVPASRAGRDPGVALGPYAVARWRTAKPG